MMRQEALSALNERIGDRRVVWIGHSGEEARPLLALDAFYGSYSLHSGLAAEDVEVGSIEAVTGTRYADWSAPGLGAAGQSMIARLLEACSTPALILSSQRFPFLQMLTAANPLASYLGPDRSVHRFMNDKPLVETALASETDVQLIPWQPVPGESRRAILESALRDGPITLRISPAAGGLGHEVISDSSQLDDSRLVSSDKRVMMSPYLASHIPVNIGACVFQDGGVTLHTPSVQFIGIPGLTRLDLGYCGSDFAAIKCLSDAAVENLEAMTRKVGRWMQSRGFVGAFGLDALVDGDDVVFVEINPRFQASTRVSTELDAAVDAPDIMLDHVLAGLGGACYEAPSLVELVRRQPDRAFVLCSNLAGVPTRLERPLPAFPGVRAALLPPTDVVVARGAKFFELEFDTSITANGKSLTAPAQHVIDAMNPALLEFAETPAGSRPITEGQELASRQP